MDDKHLSKQLAKIMKALAHENRLELFKEIARKQQTDFESCEAECFISDLKCLFNIGAPTISHHLKELSNAGLITTEKRGKHLVANINRETVVLLRTFFNELV